MQWKKKKAFLRAQLKFTWSYTGSDKAIVLFRFTKSELEGGFLGHSKKDLEMDGSQPLLSMYTYLCPLINESSWLSGSTWMVSLQDQDMHEDSRPHLIKPHVTHLQMYFCTTFPTDNIKYGQWSRSGLEKVAKGLFQ